MGELFIFSLIIAVVSAVILFPILSLFQKGEEKKKALQLTGSFLSSFSSLLLSLVFTTSLI